jgi:hypothetical protein
MLNTYERVSALLGKPIDDALCSRFVRDIGYEPKFNGTYLFAKSGLVLMHHKRILVAAFFQIECEDAQDWLEPYVGDLPQDIQLNDGRAIISTKLGIRPLNVEPSNLDMPIDHSSVAMDTYALPPLLLTFNFAVKKAGADAQESGKKSDTSLTSLIVRLDDENLPETCRETEDSRPEESFMAITRRRRAQFNFRGRHRG